MAIGNRPFALRLATLLILFTIATSDDGELVAGASDVATLLTFKGNVTDPLNSLGSWTQNSNPCTKPKWKGIICDGNNDVYALQLENMGLTGPLFLDPLTSLPVLRSVSFANNNFHGPMPDLKKFKGLKNVYLSLNKFSGVIPDDAFEGMKSLKTVVLSGNEFTGRIPSSLVGVGSLVELWMDNNGFAGEIPNFEQPGLKVVNVSNNDLAGKIPERLSKMDPSLFAGNKGLCGPPTKAQCPIVKSPLPPPPPPPPPSSSPSSKKLSPVLIATIAVVATGIASAAIGTIFVARRGKNRRNKRQTGQASSFPKAQKMEPARTDKTEQVATHKDAMAPADERDQARLVFVSADRRERFELQDLLKASAEVLGGGEFGSSYKALLANGPAVVVKRFKEMNRVGKEEFQEHMRQLGRLSHANLLPLVAYYYRKEEKLLVTDFIPYGNLASLLHGNRSANNPPLDWPTRLKIVKGIARGLNYLYEELPALNAPHGHLKSSNVLLNESYEPLLTDYALAPLVNESHASQCMIAYKSPEGKQHGKPSKKSDVWSFGVLILEILTGKFPGNYSRQARGGSDLANWVNSVVREEWTGEVFDGDMRRTRSGEGEMLNLLQIGLGCCEVNMNKRWELRDVVEKIEELKERDASEDYSSGVGEGGGYSSNPSRGGITEDDFSFSTNNP